MDGQRPTDAEILAQDAPHVFAPQCTTAVFFPRSGSETPFQRRLLLGIEG